MCCFDVSRFARMCEKPAVSRMCKKPNGFLMCQKSKIFECVETFRFECVYCWLVCWFAGFLGGGDGRNVVCVACVG
jgi:hypothetical protein